MTSFTAPRGSEGEISHGRAILDAAQGAGLPFLVYSSVGGAERNTGIPHFESKRRIEEFLIGSVPVNFIRPTFFMENLPGIIARDGAELLVRMPLPGDVPLQMISVQDIGEAAAALLTRREPDTAPVEIAGDEVTGERIAQLVAQRFGAAARTSKYRWTSSVQTTTSRACSVGSPLRRPFAPTSPAPALSSPMSRTCRGGWRANQTSLSNLGWHPGTPMINAHRKTRPMTKLHGQVAVITGATAGMASGRSQTLRHRRRSRLHHRPPQRPTRRRSQRNWRQCHRCTQRLG